MMEYKGLRNTKAQSIIHLTQMSDCNARIPSMTTKLSPEIQEMLNNRITEFWKDDEGVTCFNVDNDYYKIISINEQNVVKLEQWRKYELPVASVKLDQDGVNTFKCVLRSETSSRMHTALEVLCIVECYQTKEETESILAKYVNAFTETTLSKHDGKDYHEIHPDGYLARGVKDGIPYEQVLDADGNVTYTVTVRESLVGMYFSENCYAVVEIHEDKDNDTIREIQGRTEFVEKIRDEHNTGMSDNEAICYQAFLELSCPRWGMSW